MSLVLALYGATAIAQTLNPIWPQTADLIMQSENIAAQLLRFPSGGECWLAGYSVNAMTKTKASFIEHQFQLASRVEQYSGKGEGVKFLNSQTGTVSGFYKELELIVKQASTAFEKCRTGKAR